MEPEKDPQVRIIPEGQLNVSARQLGIVKAMGMDPETQKLYHPRRVDVPLYPGGIIKIPRITIVKRANKGTYNA